MPVIRRFQRMRMENVWFRGLKRVVPGGCEQKWGVHEDGNQRFTEDLNGNGIFTKMETKGSPIMVTLESVFLAVSKEAHLRDQRVLTSTPMLVDFYTVE